GNVAADAERIPETSRHSPQFLAVRRTPENVAALSLAAQGGPIRADQFVVSAEVLAHAEVQIALRVEAQSRQTVVRIVALRFEEDEAFLDVRLTLAFRIAESKNLTPRRQQNEANEKHGHVHRETCAHDERGQA